MYSYRGSKSRESDSIVLCRKKSTKEVSLLEVTSLEMEGNERIFRLYGSVKIYEFQYLFLCYCDVFQQGIIFLKTDRTKLLIQIPASVTPVRDISQEREGRERLVWWYGPVTKKRLPFLSLIILYLSLFLVNLSLSVSAFLLLCGLSFYNVLLCLSESSCRIN